MTKPPSSTPWALLYNLESQLGPATLPAVRRVGRRPSLIPRGNVLIQLTADERRTLDENFGLIKTQFAPVKLSRGQIVGFALRLMNEMISQKGALEETKDWRELWDKLSGTQHE
jgi:hypothetical protein